MTRRAQATPRDGQRTDPRGQRRSQPTAPQFEEDGGDRGAPTRVVLADDHVLVRSGLRMLIEAEPGFEVVAEAGDVRETLRTVRARKPGVLVLDLMMRGGSSLTAIPEFLAASPRTAIVVLTMESEPDFARAALGAGALAFVLKEDAATELLEAVRAAAQGHRYLSPQLGARIAAEPDASARTRDGLTHRECEVLGLLALGHTSEEIAHRLALSMRTVEAHRSHIRGKVRRGSRAEVTAYARALGLVD
jgi:two-component system response regulator NreC